MYAWIYVCKLQTLSIVSHDICHEYPVRGHYGRCERIYEEGQHTLAAVYCCFWVHVCMYVCMYVCMGVRYWTLRAKRSWVPLWRLAALLEASQRCSQPHWYHTYIHTYLPYCPSYIHTAHMYFIHWSIHIYIHTYINHTYILYIHTNNIHTEFV